MEKNKPKIAIIGAGSEAEAQVALLKEKYGQDVILVDGATVSSAFGGERQKPFDPEPMLIHAQDMRDVYDYEMISRSIKDDWNVVPRSDRRGTVADVRNSKVDPKIQRNAPCPCNSGKKYKNCCGKA